MHERGLAAAPIPRRLAGCAPHSRPDPHRPRFEPSSSFVNSSLPQPTFAALGHRIALAILLCLAGGAVAASELEPHPLAITRGADTLAVQGEHFALTWNQARGGELSSIRLHDGVAWHELIEPGVRRTTVPGLLLTASGQTASPAFGPGTIKALEEGPDRVVIEAKAPLRNEKGKESGLVLTQVSTVYPEGALFIDLTLELTEDAKPLSVERASIGVPVALGSYTLSFWHWQKSAERGSGFLEPQPMFTSAYCPNMGVALGASGNLSNQVQMTLESERGLAAGSLVTTSLKDGRSLIYWLHPEQAPAFQLKAPYRYTNRLGIFLGRHPTHSRLTGSRLAYWIEDPGSGMLYPSSGAIQAMADCGATALVLAESWRKPGGDQLAPADPAAFATMQQELTAHGLQCLVTVNPGGDGRALGAAARAAGIDGFLIERGSAHYPWVAGGPGISFPAQAMFDWGRELRRGLGPSAILIQHSGLEVPDLSLGLHMDGVAFGTEQADWRAARSTLANAYLGGAAYAVPCPLLTKDPMRTTRSLAIATATGSVPLVPLGFGPERSAYEARYALPLWQLVRLVEPGLGTEVHTTGIGAVASASNVDFWSTVYRSEEDTALLVTANLSTADQDSTGLSVNLQSLGMTGEYDVQMIEADAIDDLKVTYLGRTKSGHLRTNAIIRFGVRGFLFTAGDTPPRIASALDAAVGVGEAFGGHQNPGAPQALKAEPVTGGISLHWEPPAGGGPHATAYRIYRSKDPGFGHPLEITVPGDVYEETQFRDLSAGPGERWTYAIAARGVAGQEGAPSPSVTATAGSAAFGWAFSDSTSLRGFTPLAGVFTWHDSAYGHNCQPDPVQLAVSLAPKAVLTDGEAGVVISGAGNLTTAGLVVRSTGLGSGYALILGTTPGAELVLGKLERDRVAPLATAARPRARTDHEAHSLRLIADGPHLKGYVDDQPLVTADDATYTQGRVGVVALDGHVHFDNLTVQPAAGGGPSGGSP